MPAPHSLVVSPAPAGKIYIIGDVHGEKTALDAVLAKLSPNDVLIIAGDLIDRGGIFDAEIDSFLPTSKQVMDTLLEHRQAPVGTLPTIHGLQGNHEQDFLQLLTLFDSLANLENRNNKFFFEVAIDALFPFIRNGGAWIFNRLDNTREQNQRFNAFRRFGYLEECGSEDIKALWPYATALFNSPDLFAQLLPEIPVYREYIASLPFLIKVTGENPVLVVHADLPFSDSEVDRRIAEGEGFSLEEINHLTRARVFQFNPPGQRDKSSRLVLVGHNIIDGPNSSVSSDPVVPVRSETNHINLDGGAFFTKGLLCFNLTDQDLEIVGLDIDSRHKSMLEYARCEILAHLKSLTHDLERPVQEAVQNQKRLKF